MKVCIITEQYPPSIGGLGSATHRIAKNLANYGLNIHVIAPGYQSIDVPITSVWEDGVVVHRTFPALFSFYGDPVELRDIGAYAVQLHKEVDFDLFHGMFLIPSGLVAATTAKEVERPFIASIRGSDLERMCYSPMVSSSMRWVLEQANFVTSVNHNLLEKAQKLTAIQNGCAIHNAFDPSVFNHSDILTIAKEMGWRSRMLVKNFLTAKSKGGPVIGTVGNIRHVKGFSFLLEAFKNIESIYPDAYLILVGDFSDPETGKKYLKQIKELGLKRRVFITGQVPHSHILAWLKEMDVFVLPSLYEGSPNALLEAMGCGRAIVASDIGGVSDVLEDHKEGLLVPPGQAEALTYALEEVIQNEDLRRQLCEAAKNKAETVLSPQQEVETWLEIYRKIIDGDREQSVETNMDLIAYS